MIEVISAQKFQKEIYDFDSHKVWQFEHDTPVILNFFAAWCGPCHQFAPVLEQIADEFKGRIKVYKIDIDASPEIPALFEIRSVPTTLFLTKNEDPALSLGPMPVDRMKHAIKDLLNIE